MKEEIKIPSYAILKEIQGRLTIGVEPSLIMKRTDYIQDELNVAWVSYVKQIIPALLNSMRNVEDKVPPSERQGWWDEMPF